MNIRVFDGSVIRIFSSSRDLVTSVFLGHQCLILVKLRCDATERESFSLMGWPDRLWVDLFHFNGLALGTLRPLKVDGLSMQRLIPEAGNHWLGRFHLLLGQALSRHCPALQRFLPSGRLLWFINEYHLLQVDIFGFDWAVPSGSK